VGVVNPVRPRDPFRRNAFRCGRQRRLVGALWMKGPKDIRMVRGLIREGAIVAVDRQNEGPEASRSSSKSGSSNPFGNAH
jgi:hypothetical protein